MINSYLKKQNGAATLLITTIVMVCITLLVLFAANYGTFQQKMSANSNRNQQAYEAAEAGLEYGINYLKQNSATILASPVSGFIQAYSNISTNNVALANGAHYTITYTNPTANVYTIIKVSSTGTSDDNTASRTMSQLVAFGSILAKSPTNPLTVKGNISLGGSSNITNTENNNTIKSGGTVTISGSSETHTASGGSNSSNLNSDVQQNVSSIANQSTTDYFASYFGVSAATVKSNANYTYSNLGDYSSVLNGKTGSLIWIDQSSGTANIGSSTTIGTALSPVILVINGNLKISSSTQIYGLVFVVGTATVDIVGSTTLTGGLVTTSDLSITGSSAITYSSTVLSTTQNLMSYYAKIPGSWKDF